MARAYSEDLRIRIVKAYEQRLGTIREIAKQFQVGKNFVNDLLQKWKKTGSVKPERQGGGPKPKLETEHLQKLEKMVAAKNDVTLSELKDKLEQETGIKVSIATIYRGLETQGLTRKKKTFHDPKQESDEVKLQTCFLGNHHKELSIFR